MRISDWSSDVCSSDLQDRVVFADADGGDIAGCYYEWRVEAFDRFTRTLAWPMGVDWYKWSMRPDARQNGDAVVGTRSEEHTSELQSLIRISYAVFCLKKKKTQHYTIETQHEIQE